MEYLFPDTSRCEIHLVQAFNVIYVSFRNFNVVIGHIVPLQKSRKHMQLWMHTVCSKYSTFSMRRLLTKVHDALKFEIRKPFFILYVTDTSDFLNMSFTVHFKV